MAKFWPALTVTTRRQVINDCSCFYFRCLRAWSTEHGVVPEPCMPCAPLGTEPVTRLVLATHMLAARMWATVTKDHFA